MNTVLHMYYFFYNFFTKVIYLYFCIYIFIYSLTEFYMWISGFSAPLTLRCGSQWNSLSSFHLSSWFSSFRVKYVTAKPLLLLSFLLEGCIFYHYHLIAPAQDRILRAPATHLVELELKSCRELVVICSYQSKAVWLSRSSAARGKGASVCRDIILDQSHRDQASSVNPWSHSQDAGTVQRYVILSRGNRARRLLYQYANDAQTCKHRVINNP